jgi:hypothetical protein
MVTELSIIPAQYHILTLISESRVRAHPNSSSDRNIHGEGHPGELVPRTGVLMIELIRFPAP